MISMGKTWTSLGKSDISKTVKVSFRKDYVRSVRRVLLSVGDIFE